MGLTLSAQELFSLMEASPRFEVIHRSGLKVVRSHAAHQDYVLSADQRKLWWAPSSLNIDLAPVGLDHGWLLVPPHRYAQRMAALVL